MMHRFALIGAGHAGSAVARALTAGGHVCTAVVSGTARHAKSLAGELGATTASNRVAAIPANATLLVLATTDTTLPDRVRELAQCHLPWKRVTVIHLSGALTRSVLAPLAKLGAHTMALHPAFPFASRDVMPARLEGIGWGVDCDDADWKRARTLVTVMHGVAVRVPSRSRTAYHAACAMLSNYTVTLTETAALLAQSAGLSFEGARDILYPLLAATVENIVMSAEPKMSARLTGPIARGDARVVRDHLASMRGNRAAAALYRALGEQTIALLGRDAINPKELKHALRSTKK